MKYYGPTTAPKDIATKEYVDAQVAGIDIGASVFEYDANGDVMPTPQSV